MYYVREHIELLEKLAPLREKAIKDLAVLKKVRIDANTVALIHPDKLKNKNNTK